MGKRRETDGSSKCLPTSLLMADCSRRTTFSKLLRKSLGRFSFLRKIFDNMWDNTITKDIISFYLLIHDLTTTSCNNIQRDAKIKVLIIIALLGRLPNSRLVLCQIFSYGFPKIRNLRKIFLRNFENAASSFCGGDVERSVADRQ